MKIIRERKFEPITITLESPNDLTFLMNVFGEAERSISKRHWIGGPSEDAVKIREYYKILERYHLK